MKNREGILALLALAVVSGILLLAAVDCAEEQPAARRRRKKYGTKLGAWVMAQHFVKRELRAPSTADFGLGEQSPRKCVADLGDGLYLARGWVDAQNAFGAQVRSTFVVKLRFLGDNRWKMLEGPLLEGRQ